MNIILEGVTGSTAYGLAHAKSDIDMKGVYVAPMEEVLGLDGAVVVSESKTSTNPDREYHEVGKFLKLALKCNPTILEMLYLKDYQVIHETAIEMIKARSSCLSEPAIRGAYGAYAKAQADRLMRRHADDKAWQSGDLADPDTVRARTEKHGRHTIRLLMQGYQLLITGTMDVDISSWREYLFEMGKLAATDPQSFYLNYSTRARFFNEAQTSLPQFPNREKINKILTDIRWENHVA
jgi:hypothetical protein